MDWDLAQNIVIVLLVVWNLSIINDTNKALKTIINDTNRALQTIKKNVNNRRYIK